MPAGYYLPVCDMRSVETLPAEWRPADYLPTDFFPTDCLPLSSELFMVYRVRLRSDLLNDFSWLRMFVMLSLLKTAGLG